MKTTYLKDYKLYPYEIQHVNLDFDIHNDYTIIKSNISFKNNNNNNEALFLNGEHLELIELKLDGKILEKDKHFNLDDNGLTIPCPSEDKFTLEAITRIKPEENTRLEGLYKSGDTYCTQCEAEGFRNITYYPDRPDVMTTFTTRIEANKEHYPVLLSNGNRMDFGDSQDGRHFAVWHDPFPKPCYLFALVAGNLVHIKDSFKTCSGREVDLFIYVRSGDESQCSHAMESLKKAMKWDEDTYGLEYDLDLFNIVAVNDFNMGAMENKSLNIFNTALVLAQQETATDNDFTRVEGVIGHEYFHNWSGNRVTCRDWFQLSLKEGLTVFRDQEFSSDLNSRSVQRIDDVSHLRCFQFSEDRGSLAHPIRPNNYIEINNFYTMTVYEKGAEVIRMIRTILGDKEYRKATDLYFKRHDGDAATCDDFLKCMEESSNTDLTQFKLWYEQAGTPEVIFAGAYNENNNTYTIKLSQHIPDTPGQMNKKPMHIPITIGLLNDNGDDITEEILHLKKEKQSFIIENIHSFPTPSVLRNFSAPIKLKTKLSAQELAFLMVHDNDGFNRWEAGQNYFLQLLHEMIDTDSNKVPASFLETYNALLDRALDKSSDKALMARSMSLPDIIRIGQDRDVIDINAIHNARESILNAIVDNCGDKLIELYEQNRSSNDFEITPKAMGQRALQNTTLFILSNKLTNTDAQRVLEQYENSSNMTDRMAAFHLGCAIDGNIHDIIVNDFYERFKTYPLVIDKWFSAQAQIHLPKTIQIINKLREHPDFNIKNPNRVRSLYSAFAMMNPVCFHTADGSGYSFLMDAIIELNDINPQIAARLLTPLREWRRYTTNNQALMQEALQKIMTTPNLSPNVFEIVSKTLKA